VGFFHHSEEGLLAGERTCEEREEKSFPKGEHGYIFNICPYKDQIGRRARFENLSGEKRYGRKLTSGRAEVSKKRGVWKDDRRAWVIP